MKTCLALSTAALLACTALTGCGSTGTTGDEPTTASQTPADQDTTTTVEPSTEAAATDTGTPPPTSTPAAPTATEVDTASPDDETEEDQTEDSETEDDQTEEDQTEEETSEVSYPEDPAAYAQDFVDAWADGDTARVEQLGGPRMAGITSIFDLDPVTVEATGLGQEDPDVAYAAAPDGLHLMMSASHLGEGGAVTGVAVTDEHGSLLPQAGAALYAHAFLEALTSQDEETVDRMAAPGEVREWLASYDPELDGTDYVLSGLTLVVDEPLDILFSLPDDEDYQLHRVGLSDDAPDLEDEGVVVLFTPVAIFGFGT